MTYARESCCFDSDGRRVMLETRAWSGTDAKVDLEEDPASEEFSEKLRDSLRAVNDPVRDNPTFDLRYLVQAAMKHT